MASYRSRIFIAAPPEIVFDYLADLRKHSEWAQHRLSIEPKDGASEVGATFTSAGHQMGLTTKNVLVVTEHVRPARFAFEAEGKEGHFRHAFDIDPSGEGAQVTKTFEVLRAGALAKVGLPVFAFIGPRNMRKDLQRIKARLEQGAGQ